MNIMPYTKNTFLLDKILWQRFRANEAAVCSTFMEVFQAYGTFGTKLYNRFWQPYLLPTEIWCSKQLAYASKEFFIRKWHLDCINVCLYRTMFLFYYESSI